jgi:hypothetical protein
VHQVLHIEIFQILVQELAVLKIDQELQGLVQKIEQFP